MANVMSVDLRANTERARDDIKSTLSQAAQAAREFRNEMVQLRDAQLRARDAVVSARAAFHQTQSDILRARDALRSYHTELAKATSEQQKLAAERGKLTASVAKAQQAYDSARKGMAFSGFAGAETSQSRAALQNLDQLKQKLATVDAAHKSASGSVGYYRRQVNQTNSDIATMTSTLAQQGIALRKSTDDSARLATTKGALSNKIAENRGVMQDLNATLREHESQIRSDDKAMRELNDVGMAGTLIAAALVDRALRAIWNTFKDLIVQSTLYAGRTIELQVALENVGRIQGYNVGQLRAMENAIRSLGITTQDARNTLIQFAATGLNMEQAPQLARVAQDLAVIAGVDTSEEINRLVAGIETLQIRALRTAGVFVSLQGEMKKASVESRRSVQSFSEQEKQQILLNAVLDYGARATGTYDQAMTTASKQMRTMNRLTAEMHNAIGALFQGPFGLAIKLLSTFLRMVERSPQAFVTAGAALTIFVGKVAYSMLANNRSIQAVTASLIAATRATLGLATAQGRLAATTEVSTGANIGNAAANRAGLLASGAGIGGVTGTLGASVAARSTLGLAGAGAGTAAAGGLSLAGWGLLAVAVGSVTSAILDYATASQQGNFANQENLRLLQRQIQVNTEDAKAFRERAAAIRQSGQELMMSDEQRKDAGREEAMALLRLDPLQRQAIENDRSRAAQLENLAAGLDKVNAKLRQQVRELNRMTVQNLGASQTRIDALLARADEGAARNRAYNASSPTAFLGENLNSVVTSIPLLGDWINKIGEATGTNTTPYGGNVGSQRVAEDIAKAQGALAERRTALEGLAEQEAELRKSTGKSTDEIIRNEFFVEKGTKAYDEITAAVAAHQRKQDEANGVIRSAQDLYNQMQRNLEQLKLAQFDVSVSTEGMNEQQRNLVSNLEGGVALGMEWKTVVAGMQSGIKAFDDDVARIAESQDDYNKRIAALPPELRQAIFDTNASAKAFERYGESAGKAAKKLIELKNNIREMIRDMVALQSGSGELSGLQGVEFAVKRELEARRRLQESELERYGNVRAQPVTAEEVDEATRRIQNQLETIKSARESMFRLERMEVEGTNLQFEVQKQILDLANEETRQRERQMSTAITFLRLQQDRITQEKQLTSEIAARIRLDAEEGENRRRGLGRDRIAYLEAVSARQKLIQDIRGSLEQVRAETQLRRDLAPGGGGVRLGEFSGISRFDTPDPTKRDLAVVNLMSAEQKQLHAIEQNTFNTVENTAVIAEKVSGGTGGSETSAVLTGSQQDTVVALRRAIFGQESSYNYRAVNPHSGALGFGQVMPGNVASWTEQAGVGRMSPQQFLNNPQAQVAVADFMLGKYLREQSAITGGDMSTAIRRTAASWYGGPGNAGMYANTAPQYYKGHKYPSFDEYTNSVLQRTLGGNELSIDPEETKRRNEVNSRITRGYRIPTPTEREAAVKGDVNQTKDVITIYTELIEFANRLRVDANGALSDFRDNLRSVLEAGTNDAQVAAGIFNAVKARYDAIADTYRNLQVQRAIDNSGFQASEENRLHIFMQVELARRKAAEETKDKIIQVQREIEEISIGSADRIRLAYLESAKAQARASEDALISIAQNLPKLDAAAKVNMDEVQASVIAWLAQQKSVSQVYADTITGVMDKTFGGIDRLMDKLTKRLGVFGSIVGDLFGGLLKAGLTQVFAGIFSGQGSAVDRVRQTVAGGTPPFVPNGANPSVPDELQNLLRGSKTVGRMDIQSAGQVIINATGVSSGGGAVANVLGQGGIPAVVASAMQHGLIPSSPQSGGGVFNIGSNGIVTNANGQVRGALPSIGNGVGLGSGGSGVPFMLGGGGLFGVPMVGPGGTAPFNPAAGIGLGGGSLPVNAGILGRVLDIWRGTGSGGGSTTGVGTPTQAPRSGVGGILSTISSGLRGFFGQQLGNGRLGGVFGTASTGGTFGFGNSQFAQMLPFLGASLGGSLGGTSRLGSILGTAGGALAGIGLMGAPAILTGSGALAGSLGFLAPLFSNPLTVIAGGALLIGAVLLGRNSRRRQEERQRTQILGDAKTQLQKILNDVQRDRMDGESGLAAAQSVRDQYLQAVGQLKDRKTRDIAIATVRELDALIAQIRQAAAAQSRRRELDAQLVPEFAGGGVTSSAYSYGQGRGGVVSGVDMGHDSVLARLRPNEMVLNTHQQRQAASLYGGDVFRNIGVPGYASGGGGYYGKIPSTMSPKTSGKSISTTVILVADEDYAKQLAKQTGGEIINMSATALKNKDGPLYREVKKIR